MSPMTDPTTAPDFETKDAGFGERAEVKHVRADGETVSDGETEHQHQESEQR